MNNRQATNLAYKLNDKELYSHYSQINISSSAVPKIPYELPDRRREEYERAKRRQKIEERQISIRMRSIYRAVGIKRTQNILSIITLVLIVAGLFAFVMIRQSKIVEQNFSNTRLNNQINELESINTEGYEELLSSVDFKKIEEQAFLLYGLRKPAQSQRIHMKLPDIDRVVRYNKDGLEIDKNTDSDTITLDTSQIETYMKRLRLQDYSK